MNTLRHLFKKYFHIILFLGITVFWAIGSGVGATIPPWVVIAAVVFFERVFLKGVIKERVARSFFIYVAFMLAVSVLVTLTFGVDGVLFIIWFGIMGQACFFTCDPPILLFHFSPILILIGIIFIVLDLRAKDSIIARHKIRAMLIILGVIIFFLGGIFIIRPFIRRTIADIKREQHLKDAEYYKREYLEIGEPTSSEQFIYARDNRIMVSEIDGKNDYLFKEIPLEETKKIFSVSPKGTYYVAMSKNDDEVYNSGVKKDATPIAEVRAVSDNAFVMSVTSTEGDQDMPKNCKWSFDDEFVACRYYKDEWGRKQNIKLFDIMRGKTMYLYDESSLGGTMADFTWSDETIDFFYDHYDQDRWRVYHINNIKEMSESGFTIPPHRAALPFSAPCFDAGAYQNNTIYCVTTTKELPWYKALPKNEFLTTNDGLIIAYRAGEENLLESPTMITKAPFSFSGSDDIALYQVDTTYIAVYGTDRGFFLLNLRTGKINPFQTLTTTEDKTVFEQDIETTNIFKNISSGTVPVPYRGAQ